jgi:hypothetical protein
VRIETTNMSIQADIDATVAAFVSDVADLVRRIALESAQEVLGAQRGPLVTAAPRPHPVSKPSPKATPKPSPKATPKPSPKPSPRSAPAPAVASAPPAPPPRSLKDPRRGRLITLPSSETPPRPPVEQPLPMVVKVPAKQPRKPRTPKAASVPPPPVAAAEPQPARNWVVVRRPARDRSEPGSDAPATGGETDAGGASDAAPPTPPTPTGAVQV